MARGAPSAPVAPVTAKSKPCSQVGARAAVARVMATVCTCALALALQPDTSARRSVTVRLAV